MKSRELFQVVQKKDKNEPLKLTVQSDLQIMKKKRFVNLMNFDEIKILKVSLKNILYYFKNIYHKKGNFKSFPELCINRSSSERSYKEIVRT